jgi:Fe-S-cluster containining protein
MEGGKRFDCTDCVAFCCSNVYAVALTAIEVARLAYRLRVGPAEFKRRYTTDGFTLKQFDDQLFGRACIFLDREARHCTVYSDRPGVCQVWPRPEHAAPGAAGRCGFYDLYTHLRNELEPEVVPLFQLARAEGSKHPATRPNPARAADASGGER